MASLNPYAPLFVPAVVEAPLAPALSVSPLSCAYGYPYCSDAIPQPVCPFPCGPPAAEHIPGLIPAALLQLPLYWCYYYYYHHGFGIDSGLPLPWSSHTFVHVAAPFLVHPEVTLPFHAFHLPQEGLLAPPFPPWYSPFHPVQPEIVEVPPTPLLSAQTPRGNPSRRAVILRKKRVKVSPRWRIKADRKSGSPPAGRTAGGVIGRVRRGPKRGPYRGFRSLWVPKLRRQRRRSGDEGKANEQFQFKSDEVLEEISGTLAGADGGDPRTTVMIRNIPNKFRKEALLCHLDAHCLEENQKVAARGQPENQKSSAPSQFNFFYLPIDFDTGCNLGYAFVNFTSAAGARRLHRGFHRRVSWSAYGSKKICEVTYARIQGLPALLKHFRGTNLPPDRPDVLPLHFVPHRDGMFQGRCHHVGPHVTT